MNAIIGTKSYRFAPSRNEQAVTARWNEEVLGIGRVNRSVRVLDGKQLACRSISVHEDDSDRIEFALSQTEVTIERFIIRRDVAAGVHDVGICVGEIAIGLWPSPYEKSIVDPTLGCESILASLLSEEESLAHNGQLLAVAALRLTRRLACQIRVAWVVGGLKIDILRDARALVIRVIAPVSSFVATRWVAPSSCIYISIIVGILIALKTGKCGWSR